MRRFLVKDARQAGRWLSVQLAAFLAILPQAWAQFPDDLKAWVPEEWHGAIITIIGLCIIFGRLWNQGDQDA